MKRISFDKGFVNKAGNDLIPGKIHTIRQNFDYWKQFEGKEVTLFTWESKPYHSKQKVFCVKRIVSVQKVKKVTHEFYGKIAFVIVTGEGEYNPDTKKYSDAINSTRLSNNDGFADPVDFYDRFRDYPDGNMAILHFTNFRY